MASSGLMDFWRRRKVFIIIGLIALVILAGFIHIRTAKKKALYKEEQRKQDSFKAISKQKNPSQKNPSQKSQSHKKPDSAKSSSNSHKVNPLPAIFAKNRFKSKGKPFPGGGKPMGKIGGKMKAFDASSYDDKKKEDKEDDFFQKMMGGDGAEKMNDRGGAAVGKGIEGEAPLEPGGFKKHEKDEFSMEEDIKAKDEHEDKSRSPNRPKQPGNVDNFPAGGGAGAATGRPKAQPPINQGQFDPANRWNNQAGPNRQGNQPGGGGGGGVDLTDITNRLSRLGQKKKKFGSNGNQPNQNWNGNQGQGWNRPGQTGGQQQQFPGPGARNFGAQNPFGNQNGFPGAGNQNGFPGAGNRNGFPGAGNQNGFPGAGNQDGFPGAGNQPGQGQGQGADPDARWPVANGPGQNGNQQVDMNANQPLPNQAPGNSPNNPPGNPLSQNEDQQGLNPNLPVPVVRRDTSSTSGNAGDSPARGPPDSNLYVVSRTPVGRPLSAQKTERQEAVVRAFKHAWKAYVDYAWGKDEVNPVSHTSTSSGFNLGLTLVDSLDTMWLMGLETEFRKARDWVATSMNFQSQRTVSLFETTIRVLGGLLSAYHLSGDRVFLDKATELGSHLLPAFKTPSGVPSNTVSFPSGDHNGRSITVAEAGTLQLEFRDLSRASGNPAFQQACDKAFDKILSQSQGIVRQTLNVNSGGLSGNIFTAGAGTDSYYEYQLKLWIQSGKTENKFRSAYEASAKEVLKYLVGYSYPSHMAFLGKRYSLSTAGSLSPVMDHLSCFYPGMLALGVKFGVQPENRAMAENLTHTCYYMYNSTSGTGLAPEIFQFNDRSGSNSDVQQSSDSRNIQRPETVESLFYLYRLTKDERYRDWGWKIFQAFEKYTKLDGGGYACLKNVYTPGSFHDRTESFFLAETLKYLFLLFGDDDSVMSLQEWVFNTEAHPLPIWKMA